MDVSYRQYQSHAGHNYDVYVLGNGNTCWRILIGCDVCTQKIKSNHYHSFCMIRASLID